MPRGESRAPQFDVSDDDAMSAEENKRKEKAVRAEAKAALENAKTKTPGIPKGQEEMYQLLDEVQQDAKTPAEQREMRALLDVIQKDQGAFELAEESERVNQLNDEDIEMISDEEANIADAMKDLKQTIKKTPPPIPPAASSRIPEPKLATVHSIDDARRKREEKQPQKPPVKKSGLGKLFSGLFGKKAA